MKEKNFDEWNEKCEIKNNRNKMIGELFYSVLIGFILLAIFWGFMEYYEEEWMFLLVFLIAIAIGATMVVFKILAMKRCDKKKFNN